MNDTTIHGLWMYDDDVGKDAIFSGTTDLILI